jgi:hypothetical protein
VIVNKVGDKLTGNLQGPLIVDTVGKHGEQIVLAEKRWTTRHELMNVPSHDRPRAPERCTFRNGALARGLHPIAATGTDAGEGATDAGAFEAARRDDHDRRRHRDHGRRHPGDKVRLGINAPTRIAVHRKEVYEAIREENEQAAGIGDGDLRDIGRALGSAISPGPAKRNGRSAKASDLAAGRPAREPTPAAAGKAPAGTDDDASGRRTA